MQLNIATFIIIMIYLPLIYQLLTTKLIVHSEVHSDQSYTGFTDSCDLGTWAVTATQIAKNTVQPRVHHCELYCVVSVLFEVLFSRHSQEAAQWSLLFHAYMALTRALNTFADHCVYWCVVLLKIGCYWCNIQPSLNDN